MKILVLGLITAWGCGGTQPNNFDEADSGPLVSDPAPDAGSSIPGPPQTLRFVAMGDTGKGSPDQYAVAQAVKDKCDADGCDFVLLLGDNIYQNGVTSVDDPQWQEKFEMPYADINLPFYAALGNHDYNDNNISSDWSQGPIEVAYSQVSSKWVMPSTYYTFRMGPVGFIVLDTNSIFWDDTTLGDQEEWYAQALADVSDDEWIVAAGHHPYLSNGKHGNAGDYDNLDVAGQEIRNPISPVNGKHVKNFLDDHVCGTADMYLSGHDHNRQWLNEPAKLCGTEIIVSGAGASTTKKDFDRNDVHYEDYSTEGFLYISVSPETMTGQFVDKHGVVNFERSLSRR